MVCSSFQQSGPLRNGKVLPVDQILFSQLTRIDQRYADLGSPEGLRNLDISFWSKTAFEYGMKEPTQSSEPQIPP